jgi:hypothetical protein
LYISLETNKIKDGQSKARIINQADCRGIFFTEVLDFYRRERMVEAKDSCVKPAKGPILPAEQAAEGKGSGEPIKEETKMIARVGKPAPDFEASAFFEGGFKNVKLSDYKGKWIILCFYPGDFTFV